MCRCFFAISINICEHMHHRAPDYETDKLLQCSIDGRIYLSLLEGDKFGINCLDRCMHMALRKDLAPGLCPSW